MKCYLAGPIAGLTFSQSENWRDYVKTQMPPEIVCYSPLRGKDFLRQYGPIGMGGRGSDTYEHITALSSARGILARDHFDCHRVDVIMCNLLGANSISIGTCMEIAFAFVYRVPLVLCMEPTNIHDHPMIREATSFTCGNLDDGISLVKAILLP